MGEGWVLAKDGARIPAAEALHSAGLHPITLASKEGLALINGTDGMLGMLLLAIADARHLFTMADVTAARQPPAVRGRRLKFLYMTQYGTRPPRFSVQVSDRSRLTRDYGFFLENRLRERYELQGVPLVIDYRGREDRRERDGRR